MHCCEVFVSASEAAPSVSHPSCSGRDQQNGLDGAAAADSSWQLLQLADKQGHCWKTGNEADSRYYGHGSSAPEVVHVARQRIH